MTIHTIVEDNVNKHQYHSFFIANAMLENLLNQKVFELIVIVSHRYHYALCKNFALASVIIFGIILVIVFLTEKHRLPYSCEVNGVIHNLSANPHIINSLILVVFIIIARK